MANRGQKLIPPVLGFAPVLPTQAYVLVLGTLPSAASIARQEYYGHPRNAFWPIMGSLLGFDAALPYAERLGYLRRSGVALWDVCHSAQRDGSLDTAIQAQGLVANDIAGLLDAQPRIRAVFLNGAAAAKLFRRWVAPALASRYDSLPQWVMPSTSPAHAGRTLRQKTREWSKIRQYLPGVEQ
jgi:TDG/mug DNA glycosylase family protein